MISIPVEIMPISILLIWWGISILFWEKFDEHHKLFFCCVLYLITFCNAIYYIVIACSWINNHINIVL